MAIKINGVTVIDNNRNITDVENVGDSNTVYYGDGSNLTGVISTGLSADVLLVGGGGGGAPSQYSYPGGGASSQNSTQGGGGGGGGVTIATNFAFDRGETYTITIGAGGAGDSPAPRDGSNTIITNSSGVVILRGGYGGGGNTGFALGNGGGGSYQSVVGGPSGPSSDEGNLANTPGPALIPTPGGTIEISAWASSQIQGQGASEYNSKDGLDVSITGGAVTYSEGGSSGRMWRFPSGQPPGFSPVPGAANTGDGGSGGLGFYYAPPYPAYGYAYGGAGGSGIVVIKYPNAFPAAPSYPGATLIPSPSHYIYQFTSSGTITLG